MFIIIINNSANKNVCLLRQETDIGGECQICFQTYGWDWFLGTAAEKKNKDL